MPPANITVEQYLDLMSSDKKAELGKIRFVLLKGIGNAVIKGDIASELLHSTLTACLVGSEMCIRDSFPSVRAFECCNIIAAQARRD